MQRRDFLKNSLLSTAVVAGSGAAALAHSATFGETTRSFKLKYAPHLGMFRHSAGDDPIDQLKFMADMGFRAFEDNDMNNREKALQERMAAAMARLGIEMGVFVAHKIYWTEPNLTSGKEELQVEFLHDIKTSVEVAKRVNARWMTVVPGYVDLRKNMGYQTANVVDSLRRAAEILEPHNLVMVLEPLNFRDHPGLFLKDVSQAYEICRAVDSPACKILYDIYHQQIQAGNLIPNLEAAWEEIAYLQIGDNPGRNEPTSGEINYKNVFKYIHSRGYQGILGMEHGNSKAGKEGEMAVIKAYEESDSF